MGRSMVSAAIGRGDRRTGFLLLSQVYRVIIRGFEDLRADLQRHADADETWETLSGTACIRADAKSRNGETHKIAKK